MTLLLRGNCHVFGDDIPLDEGVMPFRFAMNRVMDPDKLVPHLFANLDPHFSERVRSGDLVLAGANFGCGKPHVQGFIAMAALGMGVVCTSMPYKQMRRAIALGLPVLTGAPGPAAIAKSGDELEIDFSLGAVRNLTTNTKLHVPPMPENLVEIIENGGADGVLRKWLSQHPEQAAI